MRKWVRYLLRHALVVFAIASQADAARSQNSANAAGNSAAFGQRAEEVVLPLPLKASKGTRSLRVSLAGGELTIVAEGSSLSEIVGTIAEATGMEISGTIPDEPVFGTYGPAEVSAVICALLQGTDTNVLFSSGRDNLTQLVLTRRTGGPVRSDGRGVVSGTASVPRPDIRSGTYGHRPAELSERTQGNKPPSIEPNPMPATPPASVASAITTQRSPNGIKTPEEIRAQLLKLNEGAVYTHQNSANGADNRL